MWSSEPGFPDSEKNLRLLRTRVSVWLPLQTVFSGQLSLPGRKVKSVIVWRGEP